jgi:23S rRNA U2552 (ribose-2'-O)-methylase RlmE/FtsJ
MFQINKLTEIGIKCQTDKAYFHLFTEFYMPYFEKYLDKHVCILEIGIAEGNSLRLLDSYFPNATIYAIDINEKSVQLKFGNNIHTYLCSQDNFQKLQELFNGIKFDIIIDDGSHLTSHQQKSLGFLFPFLNKGGIYICEDLHTSYRLDNVDTKITTMEMIEYFQNTKTIKTDILNMNQIEYLNKNIIDIVLYERKHNAIQCYGCKKYNTEGMNYCNCGINLSPSDRSITSVFIHTP